MHFTPTQRTTARELIQLHELELPSCVIETEWAALSGGPCSGKSTLAAALAEQGYATLPEAAEEIVIAGRRLGLSPEEVRADLPEFEEYSMAMDLAAHLQQPPDVLTFCNTSLVDNLAYRAVYVHSPFVGLDDAVRRLRYRHVFLLDQLPHELNGIRVEDEATAAAIGVHMEEHYRSLGYSPIRVPARSVAWRARFVLEHIQRAQL